MNVSERNVFTRDVFEWNVVEREIVITDKDWGDTCDGKRWEDPSVPLPHWLESQFELKPKAFWIEDFECHFVRYEWQKQPFTSHPDDLLRDDLLRVRISGTLRKRFDREVVMTRAALQWSDEPRHSIESYLGSRYFIEYVTWKHLAYEGEDWRLHVVGVRYNPLVRLGEGLLSLVKKLLIVLLVVGLAIGAIAFIISLGLTHWVLGAIALIACIVIAIKIAR